ncbi:hypothetical protein B7Y94_04980 [Candidatus Saccharibacteria bacterium 32-49-12]|nr:MAG: hypothetical protein B7Y94_04980 [Candidatus Saccharibacteria bacterium 32-49-12]
MRLLFFNHLENAVESLRASRFRTFLTITGVTIGIASIAAVLSLANGATDFLSRQAITTSDSIALVRSSKPSTPQSLLVDFESLHATTSLTEKDATELGQIENSTAAPMAILHTSLKSKDGSVDGERATLIGTNSNLLDIAELELLDGQFLADNNGNSGIVMGNQLAIDLFGTEHALGNITTIRGENFTVVGVLKSTNQPVNYHGVDFDQSAIIHLSAIKHFTQDVAQIQQIVIRSNTDQPLEPIVKTADEILSRNHLDEKDYAILTGKSITAPSSQLFSNIVTVVTIIAGISLLVGGIGIMNIMLVNVAERRREVGIRQAIGATDGQIINQFLIESAIIGLVGGIIGYLLGLSFAFLLGMYLPFSPVIDWQTAALSIGTAMITGIFFGIYPAIRAAKRDPIESLRH